MGLEAKLKTLEEGQPQAARSALYRQTMTGKLIPHRCIRHAQTLSLWVTCY